MAGGGLNGFTLIELVVVIAIGMVMVGVGVVSITKYLAREHVVSAKNEILSAFKLARSYAITAQRPTGDSEQLDYVAVTLTADGKLGVWPVNYDSGDTGPSYLAKDISEDDVVLTPIAYRDLFFSVPEGKLLSSDGSVPAVSSYVVSLPISSTAGVAETLSVSVDAGGKIW